MSTNTERFIVDINEVKLNENNPRVKNDDKFKKLVRSIEESPDFLSIRPIVVNEEMIVLGGNMRLMALQSLKHEKVEVLKVTWLSEEKQREFIIKDNLGYGDWDWDALIKDYDTSELLDWWLDIDIEEDEPTQKDIEDEVPEIDNTIMIVREWDVFQLWNHTLMCGDSMNEECIKILLKDKNEVLTHCISDPPYWIAYNPDKHWMIKNDDVFLDYTQLAKKYTDWFFCMWTWYQVLDTWTGIVKNTFDKITNLIIWHKWWGGMWDCARTLAQDFEPLIVVNRWNNISGYRGSATWSYQKEEKEEYIKKATKEELKTLLYNINEWSTLWKVWKDNTVEYMHPTQKPVEINQRILVNFTQSWDNVLDLFGGSWSNLLACESMSRNCYMMELDPKYIQVILKRFYDYSWIEPKCINRNLDLEEILKDNEE